MKISIFLLPFFSLFLGLYEIYGKALEIHIPIIEDNPNQHLYYHELLKKSLDLSGIESTFVTNEFPQLRAKSNLSSGAITMLWMIESNERNESYLPVRVDLTDGLIGKRVLFIKKNDQGRFAGVKTLEDFRSKNFIGAMGSRWFDVNVWSFNRLKYKEHSGNWRQIYDMLKEGREYDYFSRGINEILTEAKEHPELQIENNLLLIYDRDFLFYLSKSGPAAKPEYRETIEKSLKKAKKEGVMKTLVKKYWPEVYLELGYEKRNKIYLKTPK